MALGFALGLGYAWVLQPAKFRGAEPTSLQPVYRGEYILLCGRRRFRIAPNQLRVFWANVPHGWTRLLGLATARDRFWFQPGLVLGA